jgi:hypothetical protein
MIDSAVMAFLHLTRRLQLPQPKKELQMRRSALAHQHLELPCSLSRYAR